MMRKRRGTSLIEIMVVVALLGVMISATGVCLHGVYRVDQQTRQAVVHATAVDRLSLQFRADAHAAMKASVQQGEGQDPPAIVFAELDGRTTEYRQQRNHIIRTVARSGEVVHREGYLLRRGSVATWRVEGQSPAVASLDITPAATPGNSARQEHCEAIVGLVEVENH